MTVKIGSTDFPIHQKNWVIQTSVCNKSDNIMLDGPPYANGNIHIGHVVNRYIKDTIVRANDIYWRPGFDCHGLPIEREIEKTGLSKDDTSFLSAAREYAFGQTENQTTQLKNLGVSLDFENPYRTMDYKQQADTLRVFSRMVESGKVYSRYKPVHWCVECESTVSSMEQEDISHKSADLYFPMRMDNGDYIIIWTTQAWSIVLHDNIICNPDVEYSRYKVTDDRGTNYVWCATNCEENINYLGDISKVESKLGKEFEGIGYRVLFTDEKSVIKLSSQVNDSAGTGFLHASAACSEVDYSIIGSDAQSLNNSEYGMTPDGIIPKFDKKFYLVHTYVISFYIGYGLSKEYKVATIKPHCWRHKSPLTVRPSLQWYVDIASVKEDALARIEQVNFFPSTGKDRLISYVNGRPDWCVSRQRKWGVPLSIPHTNGVIADNAVQQMNMVADRIEQIGVEAISEFDGVCTDVLDVWFDSGVCFLTTCEETPEFVVEGHDQHRGWFQSALWVSALLNERLPYKNVITHGFVTYNGNKVSKSAGGDKVDWQSYNPDIVRLWANSYSVGTDKVMTKSAFDVVSGYYTKYRNTLRFILANIGEVSEVPSITDAEQWMIWEVKKHCGLIQAHIWAIDFDKAILELNKMCFVTLSNMAFTMLKDHLYCGTEAERYAAQFTLDRIYGMIGEVFSVLVPGLWEEALSYHVPSNTEFLIIDLPHWVDMCETKARISKEWEKIMVKGSGAIAWAKATIPNDYGLTYSELTQWFGCSIIEVGEFSVTKIDGVQCETCRMVFVGDTCNHCR